MAGLTADRVIYRQPDGLRGEKMPAVVSDLVFDIGAHAGEDTDFYLGKGFRVVAVEANPKLADYVRNRFAHARETGRLTVVEKAIVRRAGGQPIPFFLNEGHDDWSSVHRDIATKGTMQVVEVQVPTTSLAELCDEFGVPHFLKVDIEMGDGDVAESLADLPSLPTFCSFEFHEDDMLDMLSSVGYREFQIVNQWLNGLVQRVTPAREGLDYWPGGFTGYHSGYFGRDLPEVDWVDVRRAREWRDANSVVCRYGLMKTSWFDLHARRGERSEN